MFLLYNWPNGNYLFNLPRITYNAADAKMLMFKYLNDTIPCLCEW